MIQVDPKIDRGIIDASKETDGHIRIQTQSWKTYQMTVVASETTKNVVVPAALSSLKALYFTHQYQLLVGLVAIPTSPILVLGTFGELIAKLLRACHVRLNNQDFSTVLDPDYYLDECSLSLTPGSSYRS